MGRDNVSAAEEDAKRSVDPVEDSEILQELYEHPLKGREAFLLERGRFVLSMNLFTQVQTAFRVGEDSLIENGDIATTEGFRLRRGKVGFHGLLDRTLGVNMVLRLYDQDSGGNTIDSANIVYKPFSFLNVAAGTAPMPFSRGSFSSSSELLLIERPMSVVRMSPGNQLGAALLGSVGGLFEYAGGVYNGGPGYTEGDRGKGLMYTGRVQVSPLGAINMDESDYCRSPFRFAIGGDYYYNDDSSIATHAASGDVMVKWQGFSLLGEFLYDRRQPASMPVLPPSLPDWTERMGFYVQMGGFVLPRLLELAARYEWYDDHLDIDDAGDAWLVTGGANIYLYDGYLKLQVNYQHRCERNVPEMSNDALFAQLQVNL